MLRLLIFITFALSSNCQFQGPEILFQLISPSYKESVLKEEKTAVFVRPKTSFSMTCTFSCYEIDVKHCGPMVWNRTPLSKTSEYLPLPKQVTQSETRSKTDVDATIILQRQLNFSNVQVETSSIYYCNTPSLTSYFLVHVLQVIPSENGTLTTYSKETEVKASDPVVKYMKVEVNETEPVSISCFANISSDEVKVQWYREASLLTVKDFGSENQIMEVKNIKTHKGLNSTLTIHKPSRNHAALYSCHFEVGTVVVNASVPINSPPLIGNFEKAKRAIQGDKLKITCSIAGYPKPESVAWSYKNMTTNSMFGEGVTFQDIDGVKAAKLVFASLKKEDAGIYYCSASNEFGNDTSAVLVRAKNRLDALWPFLGIVAEVVILVTAILIYEKKRSGVKKPAEVNGAAGTAGDKKDEEEEVDNAPEAKDGDKEDLRQRPVKA